jgi:hypothetical protein
MGTLNRFDEPHPYPLRSFTYRTEHVRAYRVHRVIEYTWEVADFTIIRK